MKKSLVFLFAMAIGGCVYAQQNNHQIGVHFSISNFTILNAAQSASSPINGVVQVSPGIDYQHFINEHFAFFSALDFTIFAERYQNDQLRWGSEFDGMGGWIPDPALPHQSDINISYYFVDWQVGVKWIFAQKRLDYFLMPYLESNFFINRQFQAKYIYDDGHTESVPTADDSSTYDAFRKVNLSAGLGVGMSYHIAPRLSIYGLPHVEYMLLSATENGQGRFLNYGVRLGVWYDF